MNKALDLLREIRPSIPKEVLELWCKDRDAFIASHPAAEQAGGDERAAFEAAFAAMGRPVCRADYDQDAYGTPFDDGGWTGWQDRAAMALESSAQTEHERDMLGQALGECIEAAGITAPGAPLTGPQLLMFAEDLKRDLKRAALAQPSPAQAEKAEMERAEQPKRYTADVFYHNHFSTVHMEVVLASDFDEFAAQHGRIVGELRYKAYMNVTTAISKLEQERDSALARVAELESKLAELENQEPVAYVLFRDGEVYYETDDNIVISNTPGDETDLYRWLPVFTAPAAQAQQLHDLDKQCRDDVARALGLRPSQERGFAWSYLLASIKSCVKASEDAAQAQHSVPGNAAALVRAEGKKYSLNAAGMLDSGAPEHAQTFAIVQLLSEFDDEEAESHWEAIMAYSDFRTSDALFHAAELLAAAPGKSVPQAWLDVLAERRRQVEAEGWTPEHDDLYCAAELPRAAAAYILSGANDEAPAIWPFLAKWWKPRDARANYVRAGALILAEIERLDRAAAPGKEGV
ncbi:hypothetical protein ACSEOW_30225 [Pseudomonas aeruginosa]